jgi:hypothetical protein
MRVLFAILATLAAIWVSPAAAQSGPGASPPDISAHVAALGRLSFLHGNWTGEGWLVGRDRVRRTFSQTERVEPRLHGQILTVEGTGTETGDSEPGFRAFAVIHWDAANNRYAFRSWLDGRSLETTGELLSENQFRWSFSPGPNMQIRYTIDGRTAGRWHEIGEISLDGGANFTRIFEMNLTKTR